MQGVVVDFYTLYDPVALTGAVLSYTPFYEKIYASKHSFWLEANSLSGRGCVPISGFKQFDHGLNHWGVKWLRNWCRKNLNASEDTVMKENLYASIVLIQRLVDAGMFEVLSSEDPFTQFGGEVVKNRGLAGGLTFDSMMPFGEGKENSFYLSPDLGHGFQLGIGLIFKGKDDFRFSTNNPLIQKALEQVLSIERFGKRFTIREEVFNIEIPYRHRFLVEDVFKFLDRKEFLVKSRQFMSKIEDFEKDLIYFMTEISIGKSSKGLALKGKIIAEVIKFLD